MSLEIHQGDIGTVFSALIVDQDGVDVPLTGGSFIFRFEKPSSVTVDHVGTLPGAPANAAQLIAPSGLIDQAGDWRVQGIATLSGGGVVHTEKKPFTVAQTLAAP